MPPVAAVDKSAMQKFQAPKGRYDPFADVGRAQDMARESVEGYGEQLRPALLREIGTTLGGLNSIGALRSGAVPVELGNIGERFGAQVGAYAKEATGNAIGYGLEAGRMRLERDKQKAAKKAGLLKAIGGVLGAGIGFIASGGNPAGAAAGYGIGSGVGGGGSEASDASYGSDYA